MFKPLLLFTFLSYASSLSAQGWQPVGARSNALANTAVCLDDAWAYHHNPGATAGIKQVSGGLYYEARFLAKELQTQSIAVAIPLKTGVLSFGGRSFGYEHYNQSALGAGYSLKLGEKIGAGVQANLQRMRFGGNYGTSYNATVEAGILATLSDKWKLGMSIMNIGRQRIRPLDDHYTSVLRIGAGYQPSKKVNVLMEVEKQVIYPVTFRAGLEYRPVESFAIRFGAQSGPTEFAFGIGYRKTGFQFDAGTKYHTILGWTPNFGMTIELAKHAAE